MIGSRNKGTRGRAVRRAGVTGWYHMHNNCVRLSTRIAPSISPWLSHMRPMETLKHKSPQRHKRLAVSCYTRRLSKIHTYHTQMQQTPAHMMKVTLAEQTPVNKTSCQGLSQKRPVCWHSQPFWEHHMPGVLAHWLGPTHIHTLTFSRKCSNWQFLSVLTVYWKIIRYFSNPGFHCPFLELFSCIT